MKEFFRNLTFSNKRSLDERRFLLASIVTCVSILTVLLNAIATKQGLVFALGLGGAIVFVLLVMFFTLRTKRFVAGSSAIILVANLVILPVGYFLGGGIHSGAPVWLVMGIVFVFVLFRGPLFYVYFVMSLVSCFFTVWMGEKHPEWVYPLQDTNSEHIDTYIAIACVAFLCGMLFKFQSMLLTQELQRAEQQTKEIEQLNSVQNNFFSSMSHEIRTPISTIIGLNEMTMREKQLPAEVMENTLNIQNASKMLLSLINDFLDMSKIQAGKMEIVPEKYDTSRMLSEITNIHWNKATEKDLGFEIEVGDNIPPFLIGDETRIKQVIINLLSNAIKYTNEGSVTLRFAGEKNGPDVFLMRVEVEDTGIGIRKESIPYLFDTFRRVEGSDTKNIEGTGLGLSIAKQLTEAMGGNITVNSIYTKGSTFRIEIPQKIAQGEASTFRKPGFLASQQPDYQQSFEAPNATVLIVDDNEMNRIVCRKLLRATKVQVDLAESGKTCLEKTHEKHYDAIFMDHEMPQMDGVETLHNLRQQAGGLCRETPVIALTANAGSNWDAFYKEQGFSAYLSKPIQSSRLEALLLACLPEDLVEVNYAEPDKSAGPAIYERVSKRAYLVTTDSIADLPESLIREHEIRVLPFYIKTKKGRFQDTTEIDANNLLEYLQNTADTTAQSTPASVEEYEHFFGEALTDARYVVHISSSRYLSAAYQTACQAAESFGNVAVVDSGQITIAQGMVAIRAAELLRSGVRLEEVLPELERYQKTISLHFLVPNILQSNTKQRVPWLAQLLVKGFNMDPIFTTNKGRLTIRRFLMGYIRSTPDQFIRKQLMNKRHINMKRLYVIFNCCTWDEREHILEEIERYAHFEEVIVNRGSATNYINCGPHSFGLIFEETE